MNQRALDQARTLSEAALHEARESKRPYMVAIPRIVAREDGDDTRSFDVEIKNTGGSPATEPFLTVVRCEANVSSCSLVSAEPLAGELGGGGVLFARVVPHGCGLGPTAAGHLFVFTLEYGDPIAGAITKRFYFEFVENSERKAPDSPHVFIRATKSVETRLAGLVGRLPQLREACRAACGSGEVVVGDPDSRAGQP
jgi:hypothetical protein